MIDLLEEIWKHRRGITIILLLLAWSIMALNTPTENTKLAIGDNISKLAKEYGISYANLSEIDDQDAAVFWGRIGDYWWNPKTVQLYNNETDFIKDAGLRGKIYYQQIASRDDSPDNKHAKYLTGFYINYWWVNKTTPGSIGKYQIRYVPRYDMFNEAIVKKQTDKEIEFYNDRWQALLWHYAPFSPGFLLPIALIIFLIIIFRERR